MPPSKQLMRVAVPVAITHDGTPMVLNPEDLYPADNPIVRAHPNLFAPAEATVESATAAPGEKRNR